MCQTMGNPRHLNRIGYTLFPKRVDAIGFVGQRDVILNAIQMADRCMNIHGLHGIPTCDVQDVVHLCQSQKVAVVLLVAYPAAPVSIRAIRCTCHHIKNNVVSTHSDVVLSISGMQREFRRHSCNGLNDQIRIKTHTRLAFPDIGSRLFHYRTGPLMQHVQTRVRQQFQRCLMDMFDLIIRNQRDGGIGAFQPRKRALRDSGCRCCPLTPAPTASAFLLGQLFSRHLEVLSSTRISSNSL